MSLNFIIAWKNDKVLIWLFTLALIKINYGQIGDQKGSFIQQTQYFRQSARWKPMFFPDQINFYQICPSDRHVWESDFSHKPVGLLTCDILEVHSQFYWPGPSGLWLSSKTRMHALVDDPSWNVILSLFNCLIFLEQNYKN